MGQLSQPLPAVVQDQAVDGVEPLHILWIGDASVARRFVSRRASHIQITAHEAGARPGSLIDAAPQVDILVIDEVAPSADISQALTAIESQAIDVPVVVLTVPGSDMFSDRIGRVAVCDVVVKTQDFVHQLLPTFSQVRARHDLLKVLHAARQTEERLRMTLETQPAATCVIGPDGRFIAINRAGLSALGASGDQVIGRSFTSFLPAEAHTPALQLFSQVSQGASGELEHEILCGDGSVRSVRTQAVALNRTDGIVALVALHDRSGRRDPGVDHALQAERESLEAERRNLDESLRSVDAMRATVLSEFEREREEMLQAQQTLQSQYDALSGAHGETERAAEADRARHAAALSDVQDERERLASVLVGLEARVATQDAEWAAERTEWTRTLEAATAERSAVGQELEREREALREAQQSLQTLQTVQAQHEVLAAAHVEAARAAEADRASHAAALSDVQDERERLASVLVGLEARVAAQDVEWAAERTEWTRTLEAATAERSAVGQELEREREELRQAQQSLQTVQAQHEVLAAAHVEAARAAEAERARHAAALSDVQDERERLASVLVGLEARVAAQDVEWAAERTEWTRTLEATTAERSAVGQELEREREELRQAQQSLQTVQAQYEVLAAAHVEAAQAAEAQRASHAAALSDVQDERERLASVLVGLEARVAAQDVEWAAERTEWTRTLEALSAERSATLDALERERRQASESAAAEAARILERETERARYAAALAELQEERARLASVLAGADSRAAAHDAEWAAERTRRLEAIDAERSAWRLEFERERGDMRQAVQTQYEALANAHEEEAREVEAERAKHVAALEAAQEDRVRLAHVLAAAEAQLAAQIAERAVERAEWTRTMETTMAERTAALESAEAWRAERVREIEEQSETNQEASALLARCERLEHERSQLGDSLRVLEEQHTRLRRELEIERAQAGQPAARGTAVPAETHGPAGATAAFAPELERSTPPPARKAEVFAPELAA